MSDIKWERLNPAKKPVRPGFDDLFAEYNGVGLFVTLSYYEDECGEVRKDWLDLRWSVSHKNSNEFELLGAGSYQILSATVTDQEFGKIFDLFKRRAEGIAKGWVEE